VYSTGDTYNIQALAYKHRFSVAIAAETITPNQYVLFVILAASQWRLMFIEHFVALLFFLLLLVIAVVIKRHTTTVWRHACLMRSLVQYYLDVYILAYACVYMCR